MVFSFCEMTIFQHFGFVSISRAWKPDDGHQTQSMCNPLLSGVEAAKASSSTKLKISHRVSHLASAKLWIDNTYLILC